MKIRLFVSGCAAFFATWLTVTYLREVPHENYPRLGRGSLPVSAQAITPSLPDEDHELFPEVAVVE
jgi:hypothetical protein